MKSIDADETDGWGSSIWREGLVRCALFSSAFTLSWMSASTTRAVVVHSAVRGILTGLIVTGVLYMFEHSSRTRKLIVVALFTVAALFALAAILRFR